MSETVTHGGAMTEEVERLRAELAAERAMHGDTERVERAAAVRTCEMLDEKADVLEALTGKREGDLLAVAKAARAEADALRAALVDPGSDLFALWLSWAVCQEGESIDNLVAELRRRTARLTSPSSAEHVARDVSKKAANLNTCACGSPTCAMGCCVACKMPGRHCRCHDEDTLP